ncbi:MAG: biotin--[acetyl-CoA-carboxylase] ligase [Muribaculaceae bacterium]|nr:biotin--[acetyl-CoA-carboxylase] ligase [Muribaculaceae bacterium]MDE7093270.1 biotin--[acetyl-CoA-carboxylase] ligase [Muribaculaceae bacterium]
MNLIEVAEATSTNTLAASMPDAPHGTVIRAIAQTAGRGQRGNSWESESGKNLTVSIVVRPDNILAYEQFLICRAVSVALVQLLDRVLPGGIHAEIKWPNDIYVSDKKICGILIENSLTGITIDRSILGVGLNVNQREFLSDAPNPVSIININGGVELDLVPLVNMLWELVDENLSLCSSDEGRRKLTENYDSRLWRRSGFHTFAYPDGQHFEASIKSIADNGVMTLQLRDGSTQSFAFKEVQFVL